MSCENLKDIPNSRLIPDLLTETLTYNKLATNYTGLRHFGPVTVNESRRTRRNRRQCEKYDLLFTYLSTTALFSQLSGDLSIDYFTLPLWRLIAKQN